MIRVNQIITAQLRKFELTETSGAACARSVVMLLFDSGGQTCEEVGTVEGWGPTC